MKTAEEWRVWYYMTRGRPVEPASFVDDILCDLAELEAANRVLTLTLARQDGVGGDERA